MFKILCFFKILLIESSFCVSNSAETNSSFSQFSNKCEQYSGGFTQRKTCKEKSISTVFSSYSRINIPKKNNQKKVQFHVDIFDIAEIIYFHNVIKIKKHKKCVYLVKTTIDENIWKLINSNGNLLGYYFSLTPTIPQTDLLASLEIERRTNNLIVILNKKAYYFRFLGH